jgi:bacteriocin-like protein
MAETHAGIDELSIDELNVVSGGDGKPATTLGGTAGGRGHVITNGGNNRNVAQGAFSFAGQD